jgi:hypothetical protein
VVFSEANPLPKRDQLHKEMLRLKRRKALLTIEDLLFK